MTDPGAPDEEAARRWREWSHPPEPGASQGTTGIAARPGSSSRPPSARSRFTARTMGLTGSTLIAALAIVLTSLTALPGAGTSPSTSSSLQPAGTGTKDSASCIASTGNLLCQRSAPDFDSRTKVIDPLISASGPGTQFSVSQELMIDGDPATAWTSVGDPTGASILLKFREPVEVGTVGLSARPESLVVTWSFERLRQGTPACIDGSSGDYGSALTQHLGDGGGTIAVVPSVRTCKIRIQLDAATAAGPGGSLAISELTLRAPGHSG